MWRPLTHAVIRCTQSLFQSGAVSVTSVRELAPTLAGAALKGRRLRTRS